jgi:hypothetical protein
MHAIDQVVGMGYKYYHAVECMPSTLPFILQAYNPSIDFLFEGFSLFLRLCSLFGT